MRKLLLTAVLALASPAWADVPPPDISGCRGKEAGAACETDQGTSGVCQQETCSRLDYSNGVPPTSKDYPCLQCMARPSSPEAAPAPAPEPAPSTPAPAPAPSTVAAVSPAAASTPEKKAGSCAAMPGAPLALGVLWVGWLARRRQRAA